jgi:alpha-1,3-rhamnosyltransferase
MLEKNKNMPLVSVVIPCYNHQDFVQQAIQSVINQDYSNIELLIIDDGSLDGSVTRIKEMIAACEKRFRRFEFRSRSNKGLCVTLNEALEWCKGEFLSTVASDDIWLSHKTRKQVEIFKNAKDLNIAVISGEMISIDSKGMSNVKPSFCPPEVTIYQFLDVYHAKARINAPTAMIRMQCVRDVGGYNVDVIIEDFYMWLSITNLGYSIMAVDDIYSKYRIHDDNTFSKIEKMQKSIIKILQIFSPSESDFLIAVQHSNLRSFKAAAVYQKKYALKLLFRGKVNIFSKGIPFYVLVLILPNFVFISFLNTFRYLKRYLKTGVFADS